MLLSFLGSFLGVVDDHLASDVRGCGSAVAGNAALWQAGLPAGSGWRLGIPLQSITSSFDHGGLVVDNQRGKRFLVASGVVIAIQFHQPVAAAPGALGGGRVIIPDHGSSWLFNFWRQFW